MTLEEKRAIAEQYLGPVDWISDHEGFCQCPGREGHSTPNREHDTKIFVDGVPTIFCFHTSCQQEKVPSFNYALRKMMDAPLRKDPESKRQREKQKAEWIEAMELADDTRTILQDILPFYWRGPDLLTGRLNPADSRQAFFNLFAATDHLWIGEVFHSGFPNGRNHFHSRQVWERIPRYWPFTCAGVFSPENEWYRQDKYVIRQDYFILEFDKLDPDPLQNQLKSAAFFFYLAETYKLQGKLVVDSGNKSLHFWVLADPIVFTSQFFIFLKALGADSSGWKAAQPVRFPGILRKETGRLQSAIIL